MKCIRFIDLFAGIGGFHYGIERAWSQQGQNREEQSISSEKNSGNTKTTIGESAGLHCVYSNEWDKYANSIYKKHFGECDSRDIRTIPATDIPDHDLLCAGFPCQAFSIAGKRRGFDDTRGTLFFEIARIVKDHQPMFLLLENVKGLISHNGGKTIEVILETLQQLGYYTNYEVHNSKNFGVPQNRERIFFLCTHIKSLLSVGQNKRTTSSERIIQEWLFQILLNNLKEAKKVQGTESKDWVLGYLLCREISQNPELKGESILDGITPPTAGNTSLFQGGEVWQNIDIWLKKNSADDLQELKQSTILTEIKKIIESKTYTYSRMFRAILLATVLLRKSSNPLWNEVLSSLTLIQEDTKYERINNKAKKGIITESGTLHLTDNLQDFSKYFSLRHLRGTPRPKVFPVGQDGEFSNQEQQQPVFRKIQATEQKDGSNSNKSVLEDGKNGQLHYIGGIIGKRDKWLKDGKDNSRNFSQGQRVYGTKGISSTLAGNAGGLGGKTGLYAVETLQQQGINDKMNNNASTQENNAIKVLSALQEEIGTEAFAKWGLGILDTFQPKKVLQPILHGTGIRYSTSKIKSKVDDSTLARQKVVSERELRYLWKRECKRCSSQKRGLARQFIKQLTKALQRLPQQTTPLSIRRLTPVECERLQSFPDDWTKYGSNGEIISDTQRYKCLGNAVTTNVITWIGEQLLK